MPSGKRITIRHVADRAGVAVSTVSNVVNGHPHVSEATKAAVFAAIEELGYRPSRAARSLPAGRTFLLGYCMPTAPEPNAAMDTFLHQIAATASESDLEMLLFTQHPGQSGIEPYAEILRRGGVDGFVLSDVGYDDERIGFLRERNVPFACFGRIAGSDDTSWVDVDGAAGIAAAVDHLCDLGHERIAFVGWPEGSATGDVRHHGFRSATESAGLDADRVVRTLNGFDEGRKLAHALIADHRPTAVVCVSDVLGLGVMSGLRDLDLRPGADVAVTGFDDIPAASLTVPGLTSVRQPMERVGTLLVERLVAQLTGAAAPDSALVVPDLIIRASSNHTVS